MNERTASCEERIDGILAELESHYTNQYAEMDDARRDGDNSRAAEIENEPIPHHVRFGAQYVSTWSVAARRRPGSKLKLRLTRTACWKS
jgi:hypothetical protein